MLLPSALLLRICFSSLIIAFKYKCINTYRIYLKTLKKTIKRIGVNKIDLHNIIKAKIVIELKMKLVS